MVTFRFQRRGEILSAALLRVAQRIGDNGAGEDIADLKLGCAGKTLSMMEYHAVMRVRETAAALPLDMADGEASKVRNEGLCSHGGRDLRWLNRNRGRRAHLRPNTSSAIASR